MTSKGTLLQVFYLSEDPLPFRDPILIQGRGELTREKVREAIVHKAGRKYQHDWLYLHSINSIKHQ